MLYFDIEEKLIPEKINELSKLYNSSVENMRYKIIYTVENSSQVALEVYEMQKKQNVKESDSKTVKGSEEFKLEIEKDGIFLTVNNSNIEFNKLSEAMIEQDIITSDYSKIEQAIKRIGERVKICEADSRLLSKPSIDIKIEGNGMKALLKVSKRGNFNNLTEQDIYDEIAKNGINYGINREEIAKIIENKEKDTYIKIAEGIEKENGNDAVIIMNFEIVSPDKSFKAIEKENGQIDFKALDLFTTVNKGDIIATKIPATEGVIGRNVFGDEILPISGKDKILRTGKNTISSEDGLKIIADIDGMIVKEQDKISVMEVYKVNNVSIETGNIEFNGNVLVKGDVLSGYSITAAGNIEISGNVELCFLKAGGDIVIKGGIAGQSGGKIEAHGAITAKFAESVEMVAEGDITINEEIINCKIACGGFLKTINKKGHIIGGEIIAAKGIETANIGSIYGGKTFVDVGNNPLLVKEIERREKEINSLKIKVSEIDKNIVYLETKREYSEYKFSETDQEKLDGLRKAKFSMSYYIAEAEVSLAEYKNEQEVAKDAEIKSSGVCYPGSVLKIKDKKFKIVEEMTAPTFYYEDAEIKYKYV